MSPDRPPLPRCADHPLTARIPTRRPAGEIRNIPAAGDPPVPPAAGPQQAGGAGNPSPASPATQQPTETP